MLAQGRAVGRGARRGDRPERREHLPAPPAATAGGVGPHPPRRHPDLLLLRQRAGDGSVAGRAQYRNRSRRRELDRLASAYLGDRRSDPAGRQPKRNCAGRVRAGDVVINSTCDPKPNAAPATSPVPLTAERSQTPTARGRLQGTSTSSPTAAARTACTQTTPSGCCAIAAAALPASRTATPNGPAELRSRWSGPRRVRMLTSSI